MKIKSITRGQAQEAMKNWIDNYPNLPSVDEEFSELRKEIQEINNTVRKETNDDSDLKKSLYYLDYRFGILLFEYLKKCGFSLRDASSDGFWRYLSVVVAPDVVAQRWGKDNESHYWSQPSRNWFRSLWWFVYLSWQGDVKSTNDLLSCKHFTTDTILNFEERTGRKGTYVEVYRQIIKCYAEVPDNIIREQGRGRSKGSDDLFRVVMKLNTARLMVTDPALYAGGARAYAISLFKDAGVDLNVA